MKIRNTKAKVVKRVIGAGEEPVDGIIIDTSTPNLEKIAECYINNKDKYRFVCPSCGVEVFPRRAPRRTSDILKHRDVNTIKVQSESVGCEGLILGARRLI